MYLKCDLWLIFWRTMFYIRSVMEIMIVTSIDNSLLQTLSFPDSLLLSLNHLFVFHLFLQIACITPRT